MTENQLPLTCFFPCYNDAGTIGSLVAGADTIAREQTSGYEIIVVVSGALAAFYEDLGDAFYEKTGDNPLSTGFQVDAGHFPAYHNVVVRVT